jgi:flagellar basal-body rod modification protein FlgD
MELSGINTYSEYASEQTSTAGSQDLDKEAFLGLLTAQLQHQDPLDPQDNSEFVAQLAQFSSLEQMMGVNESVKALYMAVASLNNASMTQLLGTDVVAAQDSFNYSGEGDVDLHYDASSSSASATLTIMDENGTVVYSEELGDLDAGDGTITWDGTDTAGNTVPEGSYTFNVAGYDTSGNPTDIQEIIRGEVDGMSYESGTPVPTVNGIEIDLATIIEVRKHVASGED